MNRLQAACAAVLLSGPCALADPVFFDDFDGDDLAPWWALSDPPMEYSIGGGLLTVSKVFQQVGEGIYAGAMGAFIDPLPGDFNATCRMGWAPGQDRIMFFEVLGPGAEIIAHWGYREWDLPQPMVYVQTGFSGQKFFPAPEPGLHDFEFVRRGDALQFALDGMPIIELPDLVAKPISRITLWFAGPKTNMAPLYVDRIHLVPSPGTAMFLPAAAWCLRRRRAVA